MPIIKPIYSVFGGFIDYFKPKKKQAFDQVVFINLNGTMKAIGFITERDINSLPEGFNDADSVLVYLPLSYMIGSYAILVAK
ncbi:MAG: hypothetical protein ISEC1_P1894 [Thiomicrorhabdus sp.]|nr:MAG: hypothetical protein ISEC1_P1894 [Thiomicrorhabdus sp.]